MTQRCINAAAKSRPYKLRLPCLVRIAFIPLHCSKKKKISKINLFSISVSLIRKGNSHHDSLKTLFSLLLLYNIVFYIGRAREGRKQWARLRRYTTAVYTSPPGNPRVLLQLLRKRLLSRRKIFFVPFFFLFVWFS